MRLWSLHPRYLDRKGLLAIWREGLLAKKVLEGKTRGYKNHPQLTRFKNCDDPVSAINAYLFYIFLESQSRGFLFDGSKINGIDSKNVITVSEGQLAYELGHLLKKIKLRDPVKFAEIKKAGPGKIDAHPIFEVVAGKVEEWERL
ncbi:MAG: hypothetical protein JXB45_04470 [Candidatus Krumholzibacteriota bacterium]|nr:hypothetical protein [Candidatus Krumholzibacteriota bacterium]